MQGEHSSQNSFFGMNYEELIAADHLLRKLAAAVDLGLVAEIVSDCYYPDNGRPSWNPLVLFSSIIIPPCGGALSTPSTDSDVSGRVLVISSRQ